LREVIAWGLVVVFADVFLWNAWGGLGHALLLVVLGALVLLSSRKICFSTRAVTVGGFLVLVACRSAYQASAATAFVGTGLLVAFAVALRVRRGSTPALLGSVVLTVVGAPKVLHRFAFGASRLLVSRRVVGWNWAAVFIPAGMMLVFGVILTAANPLLERWAGLVWARLTEGVGPTLLFRVVFWGGVCTGGAALIRPSCWRWSLESVLDDARVEAGGPRRHAVVRNLLGGLALLFLAYNGLDAVYLWAGAPPPGMNHTVYAHRGSVWLTVALGLATGTMGAVFRGGTPVRSLRLLAYGWASQCFVLAAGTFRRISVYINESGLTELRIVGIAGTVLVAVGLALVVVKVARGLSFGWMVGRQLDAFGVAWLLFLVLPTEACAMRFNVERIMRGEDQPLLHLFQQRLTNESVPELVRLLEHPDPVVARGVAALLEARRTVPAAPAGESWTEWQGAAALARRALSKAEARRVSLRVDRVDVDSGDVFKTLNRRAWTANWGAPSE
jgi:hypothetical protein